MIVVIYLLQAEDLMEEEEEQGGGGGGGGRRIPASFCSWGTSKATGLNFSTDFIVFWMDVSDKYSD